MEHNEVDLQRELNERAEKLDSIDPATPSFGYFKALVDQQQSKARRAQKIQLALFIVVAVALVSAVMLLSGIFEFLFLALQGAALAGAILGLAVFFHRTRHQGEGAR